MTQHANSHRQFDVFKMTLDKNIDSFRHKRDSSRQLAFRFKITTISVGALTTMVLGLKPYVDFTNSDAILSSIALVLSAVIPIFTAWEAFFDYRWLWIRYTGALNSLYAIRDELEYAHAAGALAKEQLDPLFSRLQRTLEDVDSAWVEKRRTDAKPEQIKAS
jgi:Protein of unknown function (DUF4231)